VNPTIVSPLISAVVLADSISPDGVRLTTMELVYPRMILAELNTHRVFSKNSASSRAIPTPRMIKMIREHPAVPASWRMNQAGMQGYELAPEETLIAAQGIWLEAMEDAIHHAERLDALGIHKQNVNRLVEPFVHMKTVMTGVYWENFYGLRDHHMADPTIEALAKAIRTARDASTPERLACGEWHLPYVSKTDLAIHGTNLARKISAARCARTSYNNMDGKASTSEADIALHDRLLIDQPIHASPAEHQATPDKFIYTSRTEGHWERPEAHGNLTGWVQYRKLLPNENMDTAI
jgi:thymidylate synthase ThyX